MLEVGAGVGVLTRALAGAVAWVHAVEIDTRLEPLLTEVLQGQANVTVLWQDAMRLELGTLAPAPTALVSNLPYAIATPLVVESTWQLPALRVWSVMVQREVADRWTARPGDPAYGAPSVLVQLAAELAFRRNVGREVFVPRPRVESALIVLRRTGPGAAPELRALVRAAFAQRRKTLANNLTAHAIARADVAGVLGGARTARGSPARAPGAGPIPHPRRPTAMADRLVIRAPAKLNLVLRVGPLARRRLPPARDPDGGPRGARGRGGDRRGARADP